MTRHMIDQRTYNKRKTEHDATTGYVPHYCGPAWVFTELVKSGRYRGTIDHWEWRQFR